MSAPQTEGADLADELCGAFGMILGTEPGSSARSDAIEAWSVALDRAVAGPLDGSLELRRGVIAALVQKVATLLEPGDV
jgi:hypothetical protein